LVWVLSHICWYESCHTYVGMSPVTHMLVWVLSHICWYMHHVWHDMSHGCYMCWYYSTYLQKHDLFMCVTRRIHRCDMTHSYVWHDPFTCVTWLIHICDMTYWHVWHDSFTRVTWITQMCAMTHSYVWHDSFICTTCLIHMCDMTHSCVWFDVITHTRGKVVPAQRTAKPRCPWIPWPKWCHTHKMRPITLANGSCHTYKWGVPHTWISQVKYTKIWIRHVTQYAKTRRGICAQFCVWHDPFTRVTWLIYMCDMTDCWYIRSYYSTFLQRQDSVMCVTQRIHTPKKNSFLHSSISPIMKCLNDARIKVSHVTNTIESCYMHITKKKMWHLCSRISPIMKWPNDVRIKMNYATNMSESCHVHINKKKCSTCVAEHLDLES